MFQWAKGGIAKLPRNEAIKIMSKDIGSMITAAKQSGILANGGGHPMACGLTINSDRINDFRTFLNNFSNRS